MRIHRMRLAGIGPYAEPQDVDMDRLNDAGLFLLDGPTGAGKSTILAALCFALYGSVPGGRSPDSLVTTLREPGAVVPEVQVEFTVQGRRFEIVRSPKHERPKKRRSANGRTTTSTPATVSLRERVDGAWAPPLTRADEVGRQIADVLHLDADQFMQVVMLPQGRFAEFLTARSDDRQRLLRRLFGTQRFDGVEAHLKAEADRLGARAAADAQVAEAARGQLRDLAREELGEDWHLPEAHPATDEDLIRVTGERATAALDTAAEAQTSASAAEASAREHLTTLRGTAEALRARAAWAAREEAHRAVHASVREARDSVATHERAGHVVASAARADEARGTLARAQQARAAAEADVTADPLASVWLAEEAETAAVDRPHAARQRADRAVDEVERAATDACVLARLEKEQRAGEARLRELAAERTSAEEAGDRRAGRLVALRESVEAATARLGAEDAVEERLAEATARSRAAQEAAARGEEERTARADRDARAEEQRAAAERRLRLLRARYEQAAAELAEDLEDGRPCAVCGATEHPAPAPRVGTAVTEADVADAETALAAADATLAEAETRLRSAQEAVQAARDAAGGLDAEAAAEALARATAERDELAAVAKELTAERRRLSRAEKEEAAAGEAAAERAAEEARLAEASAHRERRQAELRDAIGRAQADAPDLEARGALVRTARGRLDALATAVAAADRAEAVAEDADRARDAALAEHGFDDVAAARAARLADEDAADRRERVRAWDAEEARLAELAASEPVRRGRELADAGVAPPTDEELGEAERRLAEAERNRRATDVAAVRLGVLVDALTRQAEQLRAVLTRSADLLAEHDRVTGLLQLVRGQGENQLGMPLASYVLAGRLEEVAAAATERLMAMTDDRYSIEYSDAVGGRGHRGLDLVIRDHYVDETRLPATLSGGETFMASLALALGMADTVQAEAGGVELDTLFVDEGFGSLDSDTLDDVLEVVDGLRTGGRTVGLVSHVDRMKQEIPVRLEVTKDRRGSSLSIHDGLTGPA